jgi:hypothetical protein
MKYCPKCKRVYADVLTFCLDDGDLLVKGESAPLQEPYATAPYTPPRPTDAPTEVHRSDVSLLNHVALHQTPTPGFRATPMGAQTVGAQSTGASPRAVMALIFGILGFAMCGLLGIGGIILGRQELRAIEAGESSPAGSGLARAGLITGWISLGLLLLGMFFFFFAFLLGVLGNL